MAARITRRDFVSGVAIGTGGLLLQACGVESDTPALTSSVAETALRSPSPSDYYPPILTGMRGSHEGSYEVAHALAWRGEKPANYQALDEHYDLAIIGAGMSGLAAAWYYRKKMGPDARILILDNHDDFGGHAKRNEFHYDGKVLLSLAGAQNLENPASYSEAATSLMTDIGIDRNFLDSMDANTPEDYALGGKFSADIGMAMPGPDGHVTIGGNWFALIHGMDGYQQGVRALPVPAPEQEKLIALFGGERDFLDGLSLEAKWDYVNSVSYNQFLVERVGLAEDTLPILSVTIVHLTGFTGWNLSVVEALAYGAGSVAAFPWLGEVAPSLWGALVGGLSEVRMFPDGNASVARLLVHKLIPAVARNMKGPEDVAIARFDYGALDPEDQDPGIQPTRLRLNSTVVGVREVDGERVHLDYVQHGSALRVTANHAVLACNNNLIPHLCPEMPESQKEGLGYGVRVPFVYANVLIDNGQAYSRLGSTLFQCPYDPFQWVSSAPTMTSGGYEPPRGPDDPMVVFMMHVPILATGTKGSGRDLLRLGRHQIYATPFASYEQQIRNQLQSLLGKHGFNHKSDIRAITVNRIPHGYSYSYLALDDPEWEEGRAPHEIGRARFGRISIANTDSMARPLMDAAFDAAWRAVEEQT